MIQRFSGQDKPYTERDNSISPIPMPSSILNAEEWDELLMKSDYENEIVPLLDKTIISEMGLDYLSQNQFTQLKQKNKAIVLPYLDQKLRDYISLRDIVSVQQKEHYQRGS